MGNSSPKPYPKDHRKHGVQVWRSGGATSWRAPGRRSCCTPPRCASAIRAHSHPLLRSTECCMLIMLTVPPSTGLQCNSPACQIPSWPVLDALLQGEYRVWQSPWEVYHRPWCVKALQCRCATYGGRASMTLVTHRPCTAMQGRHEWRRGGRAAPGGGGGRPPRAPAARGLAQQGRQRGRQRERRRARQAGARGLRAPARRDRLGVRALMNAVSPFRGAVPAG